MGSITDIFDLFVNGIYGFIGAGSSAVETGSTVAGGVFNEAIGSVGNIVSGPNA